MEKNKKRLNLVDILFVVLIACVVFVAWWLIHDNGSVEETVKRSYVVELTELEPEMAQWVCVGDHVVDNVKNYDMGIVTAVEIIPCTANAVDEEALLVRKSEVPGKVTLLVTIEADTVETEQKISTASGYDLRIGTAVSCSIGQLTASGYVIGLER